MTGKYGIREHLPAAATDVAQRFHAAMLRRMYAVQLGATPALEDPLDGAIALMHRWAATAAGAQLAAAIAPARLPCCLDPGCSGCAGGAA